jgi:hypothetical protein
MAPVGSAGLVARLFLSPGGATEWHIWNILQICVLITQIWIWEDSLSEGKSSSVVHDVKGNSRYHKTELGKSE